MLDVAVYLEAVGKISDRIIQLVKRNEELKRSHYTDFIAPIMTDVDAVHKDYLDSFRRYNDLLGSSAHAMTSNHPIFEAMANDNRLSAGLRGKLWETEELLTANGKLKRDSDLTEFWYAVLFYLGGSSANPEATIKDIIEKLESRFWFGTSAVVALLKAKKAALERDRDAPGAMQSARSGVAISMLELEPLDLPEKKKRALAKLILAEELDTLQRRYQRVVKVHLKLKAHLLTAF